MDRRIRILYILPQAQQGGAETQLLNLLRNLDKSAFELSLGMLYRNDELEEEFSSIPGLKIIHFDKKGGLDIMIYPRIISYLKKNRIDIIQTLLGNHHAYIPAFFCRSVSCICGIRATSCRKSFSLNLTRFYLPRLIMLTRKIMFVSNSEEGKNIYVENKIHPGSVMVIPNGIDTHRFTRRNRAKIIKEFNLGKKIVLGIVARLVDSKNHLFLIRLMRELGEEFSNLVLLIVGDGENRKNLEEESRAMGVSDRVIFTGNRKDVPSLLSAMDIFAFPSLFPEGWPNAVGEAMCAGLPVIAYDTGDIGRIIRDGATGIVTGKNSELFKAELIKLIKNKELRAFLGKNARREVLEKYTIDKMVSSYEELYLGLKSQGDKNRTR